MNVTPERIIFVSRGITVLRGRFSVGATLHPNTMLPVQQAEID